MKKLYALAVVVGSLVVFGSPVRAADTGSSDSGGLTVPTVPAVPTPTLPALTTPTLPPLDGAASGTLTVPQLVVPQLVVPTMPTLPPLTVPQLAAPQVPQLVAPQVPQLAVPQVPQLAVPVAPAPQPPAGRRDRNAGTSPAASSAPVTGSGVADPAELLRALQDQQAAAPVELVAPQNAEVGGLPFASLLPLLAAAGGGGAAAVMLLRRRPTTYVDQDGNPIDPATLPGASK